MYRNFFKFAESLPGDSAKYVEMLGLLHRLKAGSQSQSVLDLMFGLCSKKILVPRN